MSESEKKAIEWIKAQRGEYYKIVIDLLSKKDKKIEELEAVNKIQEYRIQVIDTRELSKKDKEIKGLNLENQALFESINCNDDNMLARRYQILQKENAELKEKIKEYEIGKEQE